MRLSLFPGVEKKIRHSGIPLTAVQQELYVFFKDIIRPSMLQSKEGLVSLWLSPMGEPQDSESMGDECASFICSLFPGFYLRYYDLRRNLITLLHEKGVQGDFVSHNSFLEALATLLNTSSDMMEKYYIRGENIKMVRHIMDIGEKVFPTGKMSADKASSPSSSLSLEDQILELARAKREQNKQLTLVLDEDDEMNNWEKNIGSSIKEV